MTDKEFCILQILEKRRKYNGTVHQLFVVDFEKAHDSGQNYCATFSMNLVNSCELVRLIRVCLNETYSKDRTDAHSSAAFHTEDGLKQGDALTSLIFNFV